MFVHISTLNCQMCIGWIGPKSSARAHDLTNTKMRMKERKRERKRERARARAREREREREFIRSGNTRTHTCNTVKTAGVKKAGVHGCRDVTTQTNNTKT
jgi:hypothetical protein